jgi:hypothetical protein
MDFHDEIPIKLRHLLEGNISKDTSVVNDDINSTKSINCSLYNLIAKFNRIVVCDSLSTGFLDLIDNKISGILSSSCAVSLNRFTKIVYNNFSSS